CTGTLRLAEVCVVGRVELGYGVYFGRGKPLLIGAAGPEDQVTERILAVVHSAVVLITEPDVESEISPEFPVVVNEQGPFIELQLRGHGGRRACAGIYQADRLYGRVRDEGHDVGEIVFGNE